MVLMKRCKGFTLKELIVVLVLVVMLGGVLIPSLSHAKGLSRGASCKAHMRRIYKALEMYSRDNEGWIPSTGYVYGSVPTSSGENRTWVSWTNLLIENPYAAQAWELPDGDEPWQPDVEYLESLEDIQCPQDPVKPMADSGDPEERFQALHGSYGINYPQSYDVNVPWTRTPPGKPFPTNWYNLPMTKVPSQMYLVFCNRNAGGMAHAYVRDASRTWTPALRHGFGERTQVLYHDGNVKRLDWNEVKTQSWRKGPWMNYEEMSSGHSFVLAEIMALPGH